MKASFYNIGCKVNFAELSRLKDQFIERGHDVVDFEEKSDIIIINTCSVTNQADSDCRKLIRRARRNSPEAFIGVIGCYAQLKPGEVAAIEGVDAVFGTAEKFDITKIIENFNKNGQPKIYCSGLDNLDFQEAWSCDSESRTRAIFKVQDGCDYKCSYCTIPLARGASRSMEFASVPAKIRHLEDAGYYEVVLSGINLGEYKSPTGENFTDLVRMLDEMDTRMRFRISSIEPNLLNEKIIEITATSRRICPHFHIPLQSGSSDILKLMRRRYNIDYFRELIAKVKQSIPHCALGIDIIAGFPGETEDHHSETYELLDSLPVSYLHVFTYSERANTAAAAFPGSVDMEERKRRTNELRTLSDIKKAEFYKSSLGREIVVIPEHFDAETKTWTGWSENYIRARFHGGSDLRKVPVKVRIIGAYADIVTGELVNQTLMT